MRFAFWVPRPRWLAWRLGFAGFLFGVTVAVMASDVGTPLRVAEFGLPDGGHLAYVTRGPVVPGAALYRVYVIPGSGCRGMAPIMGAYFAGLRQAEVVVLHKRHVDVARWPGPVACGADFIEHDRLDTWSREARAFLRWHMTDHPPAPRQPVVLVGISEGAELLPSLQEALPALSQVVLIGSTGLDPLDALRLQAQRQSAPDFVQRMLIQTQDEGLPDSTRLAGRTLGYWRSLAAWSLAEPLLHMPRPVWMGFGEADEQVPLAGLARFVALAQARELCVAVFAGADHGLQAPGHDALQTLWGWVEAAVLAGPGDPPCGPLRPNELRPLLVPLAYSKNE